MEIVNKSISELIEAEYNPRRLTKDQYKQLKDSLLRFGVVDPVLVNINEDRKNIIIGGHQRTRVWSDLGNDSIPCVELNLSLEQEKELNVRLNKNTGEFDFDMLANYFNEDELIEWGFDEEELDLNFDEEEPEASEDDYQEPNEVQTNIVQGDLITFEKDGEELHRLLCGDSTKKEDVERLMNGESFNLITDPPYGIKANKQTLGTGKKKFHRGDDWDDKVPEFYYILDLVNYSIIWGGNYFADKLPVNNDWLCWHKKNDGLSFSEFELAWSNIGKNCRIFSHHWGGEEKKHPTMKPVKLIEWCIGLMNNEFKTLDIFGGSGTTMVACHQLNKKSCLVELDPKYCQVITDRMKALDSDLVIKINGKDYE